MGEGKTQSAITTHRDAADGTAGTPWPDAILPFDVWKKFLEEKIAVADGAIRRIDVETATGLGSNDQEIAQPVLLAKIIEQRPTAALEQGLLVIAQPVQKIKHWITLRKLGCIVVSRRKINTIADNALQDPAIERTAVDPALCAQRERGAEKTNYQPKAVTPSRDLAKRAHS